MPADEKILTDFDKHHKAVEDLRDWFDKLYYDPVFSTLFNRPVLSLMMTGCDYLIENLEGLKRKYVTRKQGE